MQANFVGEQATAWKAARPNDEVFILAPHDREAPLRETWDGIEILRFRYMRPTRWQALAYPAILPNLKRRPWLAVQLLPFLSSQYQVAAKIIRKHRIDLIYAHWVMPQGLVAFALNKRLGTPYVLQNHSSDLTIFDKLGRIGRHLAGAVIRNAQRMFVVNSIQREHAISIFPRGSRDWAANHIVVLPMGVSPPAVPDSAQPKFDFATISRLSRKKGIDHLIRAASTLASRGVKFTVAIAGQGEDEERLKNLAKEAPISFKGFLTGAAKEQFLNDARVFIVPSVATQGDVEGMPVALLEAMCRGKQVIASKDSNIACLPEWDQIKDIVIVLEDPTDPGAFADAMQSALSLDHDDVADRATRLLQIMSRYQWPNLIRDYFRAIPLVC